MRCDGHPPEIERVMAAIRDLGPSRTVLHWLREASDDVVRARAELIERVRPTGDVAPADIARLADACSAVVAAQRAIDACEGSVLQMVADTQALLAPLTANRRAARRHTRR